MTAPIPTVDQLEQQAHANLHEILRELGNKAEGHEGCPSLDEFIALAESAIQLRVFPLVALATVLETNHLFASVCGNIVGEVADAAVGYLPEPEAPVEPEIAGQLSVYDALADSEEQPF